MGGSLTARIIRGATGRSGFHLRDDAPTEHVAVQKFVLSICGTQDCPDWEALHRSNLVARQITAEVRRVARAGLASRFWRARAFSKGSSPVGAGDFGAPPPGGQVEGRYNPYGARVLYLAGDARTAALECSGRNDSSEVWVQEFAIDLPNHRAVRLELNLETSCPHLHYLLLDSEYLPDATAEFPNVRNPYRATHFLAHLCERFEIAAVEYPSVRGDSRGRADAVNLVVLGDAVSEAEQMTVGLPWLFERS